MDDEDVRLQAVVAAFYEADTLTGLGRCAQDVGAAGVYGEMTSPATLFRALDLGAADRFVDLGSGRGQLVLAAMMRTDGPAPQSSVGVELIQTRHDVARCAWERCPEHVRVRSEMRCGDATGEDLSTVTKAFFCNATFSSELNSAMCAALTPARTPKLDRVATMQKLPDSAATEAGLVLMSVSAVHGTWAPAGTPLYVYSRTGGVSVNAATQRALPLVDGSVDVMLVARRQADRQAMERADPASQGTAERGSMRTALMAAELME